MLVPNSPLSVLLKKHFSNIETCKLMKNKHKIEEAIRKVEDESKIAIFYTLLYRECLKEMENEKNVFITMKGVNEINNLDSSRHLFTILFKSFWPDVLIPLLFTGVPPFASSEILYEMTKRHLKEIEASISIKQYEDAFNKFLELF